MTEDPDIKGRVERLCWGVADGALKPDVAAERIIRIVRRANILEEIIAIIEHDDEATLEWIADVARRELAA
jgi:hypothetical protein